jgi:hypothetical protein
VFTTAQSFGPSPKARFILTVKANGGAVAVEVEHAPGVYVVSDTYTVDGAHYVTWDRAAIRVTPTGGAEFNLH